MKHQEIPFSFVVTHVPQNFIYPEIPETQFLFGSGQIEAKVLRPDGDWRDFLPPEEDQKRRGVDSSACYIEAPQHGIATILEAVFGEKDNNFSARFNALLSGGTLLGGDPLKGMDSIRNDGLVAENAMPFDESIQSFHDYHSWKGVDEQKVRALGKEYAAKNDLKYDLVFKREDSMIMKFDKLKQALRFSPVPISVAGWYEEGGVYVKPQGLEDNHLTLAVYLDEQNRIHVWDTYAPYHKILAPWYNSEFAMRLAVTKKITNEQVEEVKKNLMDILKSLIKYLTDYISKINTTPKAEISLPGPVITPDKPKYDWTPGEPSRHSVRVICDEEGLSVHHKNIITACIKVESNFDNRAVGANRDPDGRIWSKDFGIVQINDYWNIGPGKPFPSTKYVLDNPEVCVRWMIKMMKFGKLNLWASYKSGAYLKYMPK